MQVFGSRKGFHLLRRPWIKVCDQRMPKPGGGCRSSLCQGTPVGMIGVWCTLCLFLVTVSGVPAARLPMAEAEDDRAERKSPGKDADPPSIRLPMVSQTCTWEKKTVSLLSTFEWQSGREWSSHAGWIKACALIERCQFPCCPRLALGGRQGGHCLRTLINHRAG